MGSLIINNRQQIRELKTTKTAICTLRVDLRKRIRTSENFLKENPRGSGGITVSVINKSIRDTKNTLNSLSIVDCRGEKVNNEK